MTGARALGCGLIVLAAVCVVPAVSAAQEGGSPTDTTTTTTTTAPDPTVPASPAPSPADTGSQAGGGSSIGDQARSQNQGSSPQQSDSQSVTVSGPDRSRQAHTSSSSRVTMEDNFFSPASITIHVGDIVTWHNSGNNPHTATADDGSFDTGTVVTGQSASHMFTSPGTFSYTCTIHPNMHGTVRVLAAGGSSGGGGSGSAGATSSSSGPSEAAAVNSPNAAASKSSLASTGMAVGALVLVGLALLSLGLVGRYMDESVAARVPGLLVVVAIVSGVTLGTSAGLRERSERFG